jgi:acetylornithine/N-succinyldiaminopimelate aminotransferase
MKLFDVYPLFDINIVKGKGCHVWDDQGTEYLDLYGGHAVISIGHAHPYYVEMISKQVAQLGFYSNSVVNKLQQEVADRLGKLSGYDDYQLFLINSGAEANENALKLASFYNGRKRVLSFCKAFHGRTSLAVEVTHNPKIIAPINDNGHVTYLPLNDIEAAKAELAKGDVCAVIIEGYRNISQFCIHFHYRRATGQTEYLRFRPSQTCQSERSRLYTLGQAHPTIIGMHNQSRSCYILLVSP